MSAAVWASAIGGVVGGLGSAFGGSSGGSTLGGGNPMGETLGAFGFLRKGGKGPNRDLWDKAIGDYMAFLADDTNFDELRQRGLAGIGTGFDKLQEGLNRDTAFGFGAGGSLSRNSAAFTQGIAGANFETQLTQQENAFNFAKGGEIRAIQNFLQQASAIETGVPIATGTSPNVAAGALAGAGVGAQVASLYKPKSTTTASQPSEGVGSDQGSGGYPFDYGP